MIFPNKFTVALLPRPMITIGIFKLEGYLRVWRCKCYNGISGAGYTPEEAYYDWLANYRRIMK